LEVQALQQLHGHERGPVVLPELVDDHDVRVLQARHRPRLAQEARAALRGGVAQGHDLEGHVPLQAFVAGPIDDAHRPAAEHMQDPVAADPRG